MNLNQKIDSVIINTSQQPAYSKGIKKIGVPDITKVFQKLDNSRPTISVGSGIGQLEQELSEDIIRVDPEFPVEFDLVTTLISKKPEVVGNCNLMLIWPLPNEMGGSYDIEAIRLLQPKQVLILFEHSGASGSSKLLNWLISKKIFDKSEWVISEDFEPPAIEYHVSYRLIRDADAFQYELLLLDTVDVPYPEVDFKEINPEVESCTIQ